MAQRKQYLIDTNLLIWMLTNDHQISSTAKSVIDSDADIFYSDVSLWEIAIKVNIGKLNLTGTIPEIEQECVNLGLDKLRISSKYFECLRTLPLIHRDPFDRLIISQAMIEGLPLISSDHDIPKYGITVIW